MKTLCNLIIVMLMATCVLSCASNADTATVSNAESMKEIQKRNSEIILATKTIARNLVESDAYIDVDIEAFNKVMRDNIDPSNLIQPLDILETHSEEFGKIQAAMYRFYNNVSYANGRVTLLVKDGSELNMSERTFNRLKEGVEAFNDQAVVFRSRGFETPRTIIPKEYIESFIDDTPRFQ